VVPRAPGLDQVQDVYKRLIDAVSDAVKDVHQMRILMNVIIQMRKSR
jgi:hypothetical protein